MSKDVRVQVPLRAPNLKPVIWQSAIKLEMSRVLLACSSMSICDLIKQ